MYNKIPFNLILEKKPANCYVRGTAFCIAETLTFHKVDRKCLESSEMLCWRRMEISWIDCVTCEEVLHRMKGERKSIQTIKRRNDNWIGHISHRNCLLKHIIEGKIEGMIENTERRGRRPRIYFMSLTLRLLMSYIYIYIYIYIWSAYS